MLVRKEVIIKLVLFSFLFLIVLVFLGESRRKYILSESRHAFSVAILEEKNLEEELRKEILEFYFVVRDFLNVSELVDENYVVYTECFGENDFRLRLFCVNPAANLSEYLKKGSSAVFFSAHNFPLLY